MSRLHLTFLRTVVFSVVALFTLTGVAFASIPSTHAAPVPASKQVCIEHDVHLHGSQPATISCGAYQSTGSNIVPNTTGDHCNGWNARLKIWSASSGIWCFYDYGYLGLSGIFDVMQLQSLQYTDDLGGFPCGSGWVMYYLYPYAAGTGKKFYFGSCDTYNSSNSVFGTGSHPPKITQVYLNY